ncbi:MAG TPA: exodeoxyribonuclease III [Solirubrobacteraceae bacterium]|nr:exodeoxyribonuclease III [Solirubrobacteraceae bacterium]
MKLVTWNVNSLKARLERVLEFVDLHRPDVLCLQETKCEDEAFPVDELRAAGYHAVHHSLGRWAGVAILATNPPADAVAGLPGEAAEDEARWIEATVDGLRIASVYVPNGRAIDSPPFEQKLRFLDALRERMEREPRLDAVAGDFNVTRADVDVYDPEAFIGSTHVTTEERTRLEALLDAGYADAYRQLHPDEVGFTWWDYRQGHFHRKLGLRIDYVLLADELAAGLDECGIDRNFRKGKKPSDHAPLLASIRR